MAKGSKRTSPTVPAAAAVFSDDMIEPRKTPWSQSNASVTSGTVFARRPPKRMAEMGTPCGSSHLEEIAGHCDAGAVNRALGWAAGVSLSGVQSSPFQSMRWSGAGPMPSHQTSPSSVLATLVKMTFFAQRAHGVGVRGVGGARGHAEEAGLGVDGVEPAVVAELHPGDVVADALDLPPGEGGDHHGHVGLATGRREGGGDVPGLPLGRGDAQDQHVLGQPALVVGHGRGDAQGEALLAQQGVAAVAGAVRPDLPGLGEVGDVLVVPVARPGDVVAAVEGVADGVQALHERARPEHAEDLRPHPGHRPHVGHDVGRVGQLHADVGDA